MPLEIGDLPRFRERHPKVSIELHATGPVHSVDERFDLSIIVSQGLSLDGDFIARPLARSELVLCAAPAYLEQHGRPHHPNDLVQHDALIPPLLGARRGVTFHRGPLDDEPAASVTVQPPEPVVASLQLEAMLAAADAGLGIAALPSFMAAQSLRAGRLERVLDRWHVVTLSIHVGVASRQHLPARTRVFRDFLVETYGAAPDDDPWLTALGAEAPGLALGSPGPGFTFARLPS